MCAAAEREMVFHARDWIYELPGEFPLMRCDRCRCIYPDPRPSPEALAGYYPEDRYYSYSPAAHHQLFGRRGWAARAWYATTRGLLRREYGYEDLAGSIPLARVLGRLPPLRARATFKLGVMLHPWRPEGVLLDVGCGSGHYLDLLRALGWSRLVGVDIGSRAVRTAVQSGLEAYEGDLRSVGFPDATFDAVSMSHVLEHVDDPVALLREVRRVTKPDGRIAIEVPNVESLVSRLLRDHWVGIDTPRHLVNFSRLGLHTALVRAGLTIETIDSPSAGSYSVALFSISRARGDPHHILTDDRHRFARRRRVGARVLSVAEGGLCAAGFQVGEVLRAVARP